MTPDYLKEWTPVIYGENPVRQLDFTKPSGRECFPLHWHERMEVITVCAGRLDLYIGEEPFVVNAGETAVVQPCQPHRGQAGKDGVEYTVVMFDPALFLNDMVIAQKYVYPIIRQNALFRTVSDEPCFREITQAIREDSHSDNSVDALRTVANVYRLIHACYTHLFIRFVAESKGDSRLDRVLTYVQEHCCDGLTSAQLSRQFGYDEAYFCRKFKAVTGLPPMKYITVLKLEKARRLLGEKQRTVSEIAALCGFSDVNYFSRCFRAHFGLSPTRFARDMGIR